MALAAVDVTSAAANVGTVIMCHRRRHRRHSVSHVPHTHYTLLPGMQRDCRSLYNGKRSETAICADVKTDETVAIRQRSLPFISYSSTKFARFPSDILNGSNMVIFPFGKLPAGLR